MNPKQIQFEEFANWINSQPDNKNIDMLEDSSYDENDESFCGCLIVQYALSSGLKTGSATYNKFVIKGNNMIEIFPLEKTEGFIIKCLSKNIKTFKEAKAILSSLDSSSESKDEGS